MVSVPGAILSLPGGIRTRAKSQSSQTILPLASQTLRRQTKRRVRPAALAHATSCRAFGKRCQIDAGTPRPLKRVPVLTNNPTRQSAQKPERKQ
jgi:hypothetical protein